MRRKFILLLVVVILFCCHCGKVRKKQIKWQGKIEYQNDVRVMENPNRPFFGELVLEWEEDLSIGNKEDENYIFSRIQDLEVDKQGNIYVLDTGNYRVQKFDKNGKYLQRIGKKGQGPGEFENLSNLFIDAQNNLYVLEGRKIQIFNNDGKFLKSLSLSYDFWNFAIGLEGNIWAIASIRSETEENFGIIIIDPEGKMLKSIIEFPAMAVVRRGGLGFSVSHSYSPRVCFSSINQNAFIYGYSFNYKLFLLNRDGQIF